jgi:group I intron endonuclease
MEESHDTGVIYIITNKVNTKKYIGKAFSYVKNGASGLVQHGIYGRFANHVKAAKNNSMDCPLLYQAMRKYGFDKFDIQLLEIASKEDLKEKETEYITQFNTFDPLIGYNYFVGSNKPKNEEMYATYHEKKANANVKRAIDGGMKRKEHNKNLPPNINYRCIKNDEGHIKSEGFFVQIKIDGKLYNKGFLSSSLTMEEKLDKAKEYLKEIKTLNG